MILMHQTAECPKCKKDSWKSEFESQFTEVQCIWCGARFKAGRVVRKPKEGRGR